MQTIFDTDTYVAARQNRLRNLFEHVDPASLKGKHVLELGCGTGELGEEFVKLGCDVLSVDARAEHIRELAARYPTRRRMVMDIERNDSMPWWPEDRFDILLAWGILYHLADPFALLDKCRSIAPVLYLETQVSDFSESCYLSVPEAGPDQSVRNAGCRPTPAFIEQTLSLRGYRVQDISGPTANWPGAVFDWEPLNDGASIRGGNMLRKMYICEKNA